MSRSDFPLVSIITPCYNAERYVGEAIRSALNQTYRNKEVIVIDDGSTDRSPEVIKSFGERIRWETGPNRGGCAARNRGLHIARGELIQFNDADDLLHPSKLMRQVPLSVRHPLRIVYCDYAIESDASDAVPTQHAPAYDGEDPVVFVLQKGGISTPAPLHWKRNLLTIGGFRENLPCAQERDLHLRLACNGAGFLHFPETHITVRRTSGSVSGSYVRLLDQHADIAWHAHEILTANGQLTDARSAALAGFLASDARAYLNHGLVEKSRDYFAQATKMHPDGGIPQAYNAQTRILQRWLGPVITQRIVRWARSFSTANRTATASRNNPVGQAVPDESRLERFGTAIRQA